MTCCTSRCTLITICIFQLIAIIERQVFDFLGYMWAPIIGNFLQIIFVIIGLFGAVQYRSKVVVVYTIWCLAWLGWNIFVICFYLEVGILTREGKVLNIGTGNKSWWLEHGYGCTVTNDTWTQNSDDGSDTVRISPPEEFVEDCLIQYYYVEIIHAGIQIFFTLLGLVASCIVIYVFTEEDDSSQPVHGELEYIKMRYRSPARLSFREKSKPGFITSNKNINRAYDTITTQTSPFSSNTNTPLSGGVTRDSQGNSIPLNYNSDDSVEGPAPMTADIIADSSAAIAPPLSTDQVVLKASRDNLQTKTSASSLVDIASNSPSSAVRNSPRFRSSDSPRSSPGTGRSGKIAGGDLGYESYDSRNQLVVGKNVGDTVA